MRVRARTPSSRQRADRVRRPRTRRGPACNPRVAAPTEPHALPRPGCWRNARGVRPELQAELLRRAEQDQAARSEPEADWELVTSVDADNLPWLNNVVAQAGLPAPAEADDDRTAPPVLPPPNP